MRVAVLHGPNLRLLGSREPSVYGTETLESINARIGALAEALGVEVEMHQSNHEGEIVDLIGKAKEVDMAKVHEEIAKEQSTEKA